MRYLLSLAPVNLRKGEDGSRPELGSLVTRHKPPSQPDFVLVQDMKTASFGTPTGTYSGSVYDWRSTPSQTLNPKIVKSSTPTPCTRNPVNPEALHPKPLCRNSPVTALPWRALNPRIFTVLSILQHVSSILARHKSSTRLLQA